MDESSLASFFNFKFLSAEWSVEMVVFDPSRYGQHFSKAKTTTKNSFSVVVYFSEHHLGSYSSSRLYAACYICVVLRNAYSKIGSITHSLEGSNPIRSRIDRC